MSKTSASAGFNLSGSSTLYLDNAIFKERQNQLRQTSSQLKFDKFPFEMENEVCGTEGMLLLAEYWHGVAKVSDNLQSFFTVDVDKVNTDTQNSINQTDSKIAASFSTDPSDSQADVNSAFKMVMTSSASAAASVSAVATNAKKTKTIDDYSEYKTGDAKVDAKIVKILEENGEDLSGLNEMIWYDADETTKRALARLFEVNSSHLNNNFENCEEYEVRLENLLKSLTNTPAYQSTDCYVYDTDNEGNQYVKETYIFNKDNIGALKKYIKDTEVSAFIDSIEDKTIPGDMAVYHDFDVSLRGAAIEIKMDSSEKTLLYYQPDSRIEKAVEYWNSKGEYNYTTKFFNLNQITDMYKQAENGDDAEFIDDLLRTDGTYKNVFDVDPNNLSSGMTMVYGRYGFELSFEALNRGNSEPYSNFISAMCTHPGYEEASPYSGISNDKYVKGFVEKYHIAAGEITDEYVQMARDTDPYYYEESEEDALRRKYYNSNKGTDPDEILRKKLDTASFNQRTAFALENVVKDTSDTIDGLDISVDAKKGILNVSEIDADLKIVDKTTGETQWIIKRKTPREIQLGHTSGLGATEEMTNINISDLEVEKKKLKEDLPVDVAIGIVGIFDDDAAEALETAKTILEGDKETLIRKGVDAEKVDELLENVPGAGTVKSGATTFYDIFSGYQEDMDELDEKIENLKKYKDVSHFCSANSYIYNNKGAYYVQVDNLDDIRIQQRIDHEGINAVYQDGGVNLNKLIHQKDDIIDKVCDGLEYVNQEIVGEEVYEVIDPIKRDEVEKAMNTILYGSDAENTYDSIEDIPDKVRSECERRINYALYEEGKENKTIVEYIDDQRH